jgi:putative cardiolipin synthase
VRTIIRRPWSTASLVVALLLSGCAALPPLNGRVTTTALTDTADTRLGRALQEAVIANPDQSGIYPLQVPQDAFAARALLTRVAERSLDVQYYIWHGDNTGYLMLGELWDAAERGVRVRLLLDDNGIAGLDPVIAALDTHPNIEVRLFNPFVQRRFKALGYLTDFGRVNRRMHNKSFTADSQATIVGGRNIGDEYFGAGEHIDFADVDVLAVGHVASDVAKAFDLYWNSESAYPSASIIGDAPVDAVSAMHARIAEVRKAPEVAAYMKALETTPLVDALVARSLELVWAPAKVVYDDPSKSLGHAEEHELLLARLGEAMGTPEHKIDLISSYLVPGEDGTRTLCGYAERGVELRILTNSLAANDVGLVHAGYIKRRKALMRCGAKLYELKPNATAIAGVGAPRQRYRSFGGSSTASLHAKTFGVDDNRIFVGSFNVDMRSIRLNTELGLVIDSAPLAIEVSKAMERARARSAYEVTFAGNGHSLEWTEHTEQGDIRYGHEPQTGFFKRAFVKFMSWFPIDWLL